MSIGYFGPIKFETSDSRILTFQGLDRSSSARISTHDVIGGKPISEFTGPGLDTITFTVKLRADMVANPRKSAEDFLRMNRSGAVHPLVIGGRALGMGKWIITSVSQKWDIVMNKGQVYSCNVDVSLQEYIDALPPAIKPIKKKATPIKNGAEKKKGLGKASVKVAHLYLRKGPGMNHPIVRTLGNGDAYHVYAIKNGWYDLGAGQWASNVGNKYMTFKPK